MIERTFVSLTLLYSLSTIAIELENRAGVTWVLQDSRSDFLAAPQVIKNLACGDSSLFAIPQDHYHFVPQSLRIDSQNSLPVDFAENVRLAINDIKDQDQSELYIFLDGHGGYDHLGDEHNRFRFKYEDLIKMLLSEVKRGEDASGRKLTLNIFVDACYADNIQSELQKQVIRGSQVLFRANVFTSSDRTRPSYGNQFWEGLKFYRKFIRWGNKTPCIEETCAGLLRNEQTFCTFDKFTGRDDGKYQDFQIWSSYQQIPKENLDLNQSMQVYCKNGPYRVDAFQRINKSMDWQGKNDAAIHMIENGTEREARETYVWLFDFRNQSSDTKLERSQTLSRLAASNLKQSLEAAIHWAQKNGGVHKFTFNLDQLIFHGLTDQINETELVLLFRQELEKDNPSSAQLQLMEPILITRSLYPHNFSEIEDIIKNLPKDPAERLLEILLDNLEKKRIPTDDLDLDHEQSVLEFAIERQSSLEDIKILINRFQTILLNPFLILATIQRMIHLRLMDSSDGEIYFRQLQLRLGPKLINDHISRYNNFRRGFVSHHNDHYRISELFREKINTTIDFYTKSLSSEQLEQLWIESVGTYSAWDRFLIKYLYDKGYTLQHPIEDDKLESILQSPSRTEFLLGLDYLILFSDHYKELIRQKREKLISLYLKLPRYDFSVQHKTDLNNKLESLLKIIAPNYVAN